MPQEQDQQLNPTNSALPQSRLPRIARPPALFSVRTAAPLKAHLDILNEASNPRQLLYRELLDVTTECEAPAADDCHNNEHSRIITNSGCLSSEEGDLAQFFTPRLIKANGETYEYVPICGIPDYFKQYEDAQSPTTISAEPSEERTVADMNAAGYSSNMMLFSAERNSITIDLVDDDDDSNDDISFQRKRPLEITTHSLCDEGLTNRTRPAKVSRKARSEILPSKDVVVLIEDSDDDEKSGAHQSNIGNYSGGGTSSSQHTTVMVISDEEDSDDDNFIDHRVDAHKIETKQGPRRLSSSSEIPDQHSSCKSQEKYNGSLSCTPPSSQFLGQGYTLSEASPPATSVTTEPTASDMTIPATTTLPTEGGCSLSKEQLFVIDQVVTHHKNVFFTGSAGTGKSVLLRELIKQLQGREWHDGKVATSTAIMDRTMAGSVAVTASTGIAACNIGGCTLHSFAGIGLGNGTAEDLVKKVKAISAAESRWKQTRVLIVDEVSMISAELLDKLDLLARRIRKDNRPWGGIQLVLCGDFFQLPPVNAMARITEADKAACLAGGRYGSAGRAFKALKANKAAAVEETCSFCFEAKTWKDTIQMMIELRQVFRQKDQDFAGMLNEVRVGKMSPRTIATFRSLERDLPSENGVAPTMLFPSRKEVERSNNSMLYKIPTESLFFTARDTGKLKHKMEELCIAPTKLEIKVGAQVMLLRNQGAASGGLVNGSIGVVIAFSTEAAGNNIRAGPYGDLPPINEEHERLPKVRFQNGKEMVVGREDWTLEMPGGIILARRRQIPLCLAWALSIHKSQGQTLERAQVDLGRVFETGLAYVALSRATCLQGLVVKNFHPGRVMVDPKVIAFHEQMKSAASCHKP